MANQSGETRRGSISLPSTSRPARVSISSNNDNDNGDASDGLTGTASLPSGRISDGAHRSQQPHYYYDEAQQLPSSSPLSATRRFYSSVGSSGSSSARPPSLGAGGRRASFGSVSGQQATTPHPSASQVTSPVLSGSINSSTRHGPLPSILPSSAFLTPRKPSYTPRQYQQQQSTGNASDTHLSRGVADLLGGSTSNTSGAVEHHHHSPDASSIFAEQQSHPSLFLAHTPQQGGGNNATSVSRQNSLSNHGHGNSSAGDESNAGTVRSSSAGHPHTRSDSRQGTIVSKASREPLITADGLRMDPPAGAGVGGNRTKSSRSGSITGLLGLRNSHANEDHRLSTTVATLSPHPQGHVMPTVREGSERMPSSPARPSSAPPQAAFSHSHSMDRPYYQEAQHTAVPILSSKTNRPMRNYQVYRELQRQQKSTTQASVGKTSTHKEDKPSNSVIQSNYGGNNRFFLSGRLVTSGDSAFPFLASCVIAVVLPALFYAFESQWLWDSSPDGSGSPGGKAIIVLFTYSVLIMWSSILRTSLRDPGIIIKGLDKEPDWESCAVPVGSEDDMTGTGMGQRAKLRYFRIKDELVSSKWCETCQTYRPPRTSHCRLCDVCTEQTDHHCSFLNNCIGRRNYSSFIAFLISNVVACWFAIGVSIAHLSSNASGDQDFWNDWRNIGSIVLLILVAGISVPIMGLLSYHIRLIWLSRTTIEMLRPKYPSNPDGPNKGRPSNPYAFSRRIDTIIYNLCKPMDLYSAIQPHAMAEKDGRMENPAFAT